MKNYLKIIIPIVIIIIIVLILSLISLKKENKENKEKQQSPSILQLADEDARRLNVSTNDSHIDEPVKDPNIYYTVENILQKYFSYVYLDYNEQEQTDPNVKVGTLAQDYKIFTKEDKEKAIIKFLDFNYIKENQISENNINDFIEINESQIKKCEAIEMIERENGAIKSYSVHIKADDENAIQFFVVTLDSANKTFMIKPIKDCQDIKEIDLSFVDNISEIPTQDINTFIYLTIDDARMSQIYFDNFKQLLLDDPEKAYKTLSEEYREIRFENYDNFKEYIEKNKEDINQTRIAKYLINNVNDNLQYVCKDIYDNTYIFDTNGVLNYTAKLDTYTIVSDSFKSTYRKAKEKEKVSMNIEKWLQMINSRDYNAAYNALDNTFKTKNFATLDNFEKFMKNNYPEHYQITEISTREENKLYTNEISLKSITDSSSFINTTIIMQLKDDSDFVMSFSIE